MLFFSGVFMQLVYETHLQYQILSTGAGRIMENTLLATVTAEEAFNGGKELAQTHRKITIDIDSDISNIYCSWLYQS